MKIPLFWYVFGAKVMAEKSVLRRPQDIEEVINRGGSSAASQEENQEKERIFNLRVPESLVEKVDTLRKRRTGKISRNTWILEAIEDKVAREQGS
jgi:predicted HicB family RNase H-like nuclease